MLSRLKKEVMSKDQRRFTRTSRKDVMTNFLKQKKKVRNLILEQINWNITEKDSRNISGMLQL